MYDNFRLLVPYDIDCAPQHNYYEKKHPFKARIDHIDVMDIQL